MLKCCWTLSLSFNLTWKNCTFANNKSGTSGIFFFWEEIEMEGLKPYIYHILDCNASMKRSYTCSFPANLKGTKAGKPMGFSEKVIVFLPGVPHSFRRQGASKTGNSSDPTLQILCYQPRMHVNVNTDKRKEKKTTKMYILKKGVWKSVCKLCTRKNSALRKKIKKLHVKHEWKYVSLKAA